MNTIFNINKVNFFLVCLLPISLITGPAIPDMIVVSSSLLFLTHLFINKNFQPIKNGLILIFFIWCFYLILRSIFSYHPLYSLEYSLFFFVLAFFPC